MNVTWSGKYDWLHERRLAWLLLHHWERDPQTHTTGTIFWPLLSLFAFSAASGEIANGIFFLPMLHFQAARERHLGACSCFLVYILLGAALCLPCILSILSS
jgi:hypothetical protein